jgi:hypothetical protein
MVDNRKTIVVSIINEKALLGARLVNEYEK